MKNYENYEWLRKKGVIKLFGQFKSQFFAHHHDKRDFYDLDYRSKIDRLYFNGDFAGFVDLICSACNYHTNIFDEKMNLLAGIDKVITNRYKRYKRLHDRVDYIFNNYSRPVFVTFTFNNQHINDVSHRQYIIKFFKANNIECYVANIDYGEKFNRLHYHAVCSGKVNPKLWNYGTCNVKYIYKTDVSSGKISTYITKLTNHASKDSVHGSKAIYSRLPK